MLPFFDIKSISIIISYYYSKVKSRVQITDYTVLCAMSSSAASTYFILLFKSKAIQD